MRKKGFCGIGIQKGKNKFNYGTLFRTAQIFDADFIFIIGARFQYQGSDTMKSYRHIPSFSYTDIVDFNSHRPHDCKLIGIELLEEAILLANYKHHKSAVYLLGAEDHGLTNEAKAVCNEFVKIPGERSLNVATAGSIVLYDRIAKTSKE